MPPILKILLPIYVLLFSLSAYAQKSSIQDTVTFVLKTKISKNHRIEISNYLRSLDTVSTPIHRARIYNDISIAYTKASYYLVVSKSDSIYYYSNKALLLTKNNNSTEALQQHLFAINNIGWSYQDAGDYTEALTYFKKTLNLTEHIIRPIDFYGYRQSATTGIALIYESQKNYTLAIEQYTSLLTYIDENKIDKSNISSIVFIYLARFFGEVHDLDQAFFYANKGLEIATKNKIPDRIALAYLELASLKFKCQEYEKVALFLSKAFEILRDSESIVLLSKYYLIKSYLAGASGAMVQKVHYAEKAFELAGKQNITRTQVVIGQLLSDAYKDVGNYKKAFEYKEKITTIEEALTNNAEIKKGMLLEIEEKDVSIKLEQAKNIIKSRIITITLLFIIVGFITLAYIFKYRQKKIRLAGIIKQKNEQLKELSIAKSRLFNNISHELRTPLTLISGPVDQILDLGKDTLDIATTSKLQMVKQNVKSLKILVNDILDLSKLEARKQELNKQSIHLENSLKKTTNKFNALAEENNINFNVSLQDLKEHQVLIDEPKLEKIINNLLSNAIKHTPSKGSINIVATEENNHLHLVFRDTGSGISKNDLPKIFDRYFQSNDPTKPLEGGSGIGLSLVKELVALMEGEITVESQIGQGSTFRLSLPITEAAVQDTKQLEKTEEDTLAETISLEPPVLTNEDIKKEYTIMIVEDHCGMQDFMSSILDKKYNLIVANNGEEALQKLKARASVDLIISDVMMPIMDGFTLLETVKKSSIYCNIPVIMLTALTATDHKLKALTIGADDYLNKPFDAKELIARINNLLLNSRNRKKWNAQKEIQHIDEHDADSINISNTVSKQEIVWIHQVQERLTEELENDIFRLCQLAKEMHLSERQFQRRIKKITGLSPKKFQQEIALQKARQLLERSVYTNVTAVAYSIGMANVTRFGKQFKTRFGESPAKYF
ncbi:MAG: signal transduction histidine kinase/DNA-binding response OmpR family regulator [Dokdonia sp.]|jgi:signal transduction histidine kinase/DNA-binding response OmpR family regulator